MKKIVIVCAIALGFTACNGNSTQNTTTDSSASSSSNSNQTTDTVGLTNPISIDTTKHPSGMDNSSVISTDTAAMNVQNSINKAKTLQRKHK